MNEPPRDFNDLIIAGLGYLAQAALLLLAHWLKKRQALSQASQGFALPQPESKRSRLRKHGPTLLILLLAGATMTAWTIGACKGHLLVLVRSKPSIPALASPMDLGCPDCSRPGCSCPNGTCKCTTRDRKEVAAPTKPSSLVGLVPWHVEPIDALAGYRSFPRL